MPLLIQINGNTNIPITGQGQGSGTTVYALQVTKFKVEHERLPKVNMLPARDPLLIDLGQRLARVTLEGTASEAGTNSTDGTVRIADRDELEEMGRTWNDDITLTDSATSPATTYTAKIQRVGLERKDVQTFYNFVMIIVGYKN